MTPLKKKFATLSKRGATLGEEVCENLAEAVFPGPTSASPPLPSPRPGAGRGQRQPVRRALRQGAAAGLPGLVGGQPAAPGPGALHQRGAHAGADAEREPQTHGAEAQRADAQGHQVRPSLWPPERGLEGLETQREGAASGLETQREGAASGLKTQRAGSHRSIYFSSKINKYFTLLFFT